MKNQRSGFTLVELLVVITIIGILMGLLIPAVNAARETARRNQCSTQLKNLALAAIQYENTKGELPGYLNDFGSFATGTDPSDPLASGGAASHKKLAGWAVSLFPWLDAQPTYEHWTEDRYPIIDGAGGEPAVAGNYRSIAVPNLAIMQCPSNPNDDADAGRNSYVSNNGVVPYVGSGTGSSGTPGITFRDSMDRANGAFNNKYAGTTSTPVGPKVRLDDFKDGQGNTMLFSENVQAQGWHCVNLPISSAALVTGSGVAEVAYLPLSRFTQGMVWHYEDTTPTASIPWSNGAPPSTGIANKHQINGGIQDGISDDIFNLQMDSGNAVNIARPSSAHVEGVNVGMADGGTRFISSKIDYRVYQALLTLKGKGSDVPWPEFILNDDAF